MKRTIAVGVVFVFSVVAVAGCLGKSAGCSQPGYDIASVSPPGYTNTGNETGGLGEDFAAPVHLDAAVGLHAVPHGCTMEPSSYVWSVGADESRGRGGVAVREIETSSPVLSVALPHVGRYWISVSAWDRSGSPMGASSVPFHAEAFLVERVELPKDGSTYGTTFSAYCCPRAHNIVVTGDDATMNVQWVKRLVVAGTGEVIWEGRDSGAGAAEGYVEVLGTQWLERIRLEIEPDLPPGAGAALPGTYEAEIRIGPRGNGGFETLEP